MINKELQNRILSSAVIIPIAIFFIFQGSVYFAFFLSIFFLASSYEWIKMNKKDILKVIGMFYLFFSSYLAYLMRENYSLELFILILIICIFTDLGGYVFGKIFKGPKLTKISPKKTYAGSFGGFILSLIAAIVYTKYTSSGIFTYLDLSIVAEYKVGLDTIFFLFIIFISLVSQIGDLVISYFKRIAKIKDTGKLLPGHGGVLDRVDGIIFAIPVSYILFTFLN